MAINHPQDCSTHTYCAVYWLLHKYQFWTSNLSSGNGMIFLYFTQTFPFKNKVYITNFWLCSWKTAFTKYHLRAFIKINIIHCLEHLLIWFFNYKLPFHIWLLLIIFMHFETERSRKLVIARFTPYEVLPEYYEGHRMCCSGVGRTSVALESE